MNSDQAGSILNFPFQLYWMTFGAALISTALVMPIWRRWCLKHDWVDHPGGRKDHGEPITLAGGLGVFTGMLLTTIAGILVVRFALLNPQADQALLYGLNRRAIPLAAIFGGAMGMMLLGWLDDRRELKAAQKFAGQLIIALLVAIAGVRATLFVPSLAFSYVLTVVWIVTVTNALNFLDNMNGLAGGIGAIASGWFAVAAIGEGQYLVALLALLTCGALLGFLPYNFPRATVFLGDAGSHLVGFLLAVLAILPRFYSSQHPEPLAVLSPLAVLAVPLVDLGMVVILRSQRGLPFWIGDQNHCSHRLVRAGFTRTQAVLILWVAGALCGLVVLI
jgi:UDP-GlcNAc:undecaprenyl-phosphate GlcNAc-1-phosphate transferase